MKFPMLQNNAIIKKGVEFGYPFTHSFLRVMDPREGINKISRVGIQNSKTVSKLGLESCASKQVIR